MGCARCQSVEHFLLNYENIIFIQIQLFINININTNLQITRFKKMLLNCLTRKCAENSFSKRTITTMSVNLVVSSSCIMSGSLSVIMIAAPRMIREFMCAESLTKFRSNVGFLSGRATSDGVRQIACPYITRTLCECCMYRGNLARPCRTTCPRQ